MQIPLGMPGVAPRRTGVGHFLNDIPPFGTGVAFLHLDGIKELSGRTMTRIGRCQIEARHLTGNVSSRRDNLAPLKIFQAKLR
jgi:hypothetical protein